MVRTYESYYLKRATWLKHLHIMFLLIISGGLPKLINYLYMFKNAKCDDLTKNDWNTHRLVTLPSRVK